MTDPETLIKYLIGQKLMRFRFDKVLNEQMVDITDFGKEINTILNKLREDSNPAQATNEFAAEKLEEEENEPKRQLCEVHDYFSPENEPITCDLCGDEFNHPMTTDLLAHMEAKHPKEYEGVEK